MARNRKRAKERRARRPQPVASRGRDGTARGGASERLQRDSQEELEPVVREPVEPEPVEAEPVEPEAVEEQVPEPLEDEIPEPLDEKPFEHEEDHEAPSPLGHAAPDAELAEARLELGSSEQLPVDPELESDDAGSVFDDEVGDEDGAPSAGEVALPSGAAAGRRELPGNRLIGFLQGSWRELQRVQWPDRRQVFQATGVVIGFVIVAGVFLGVSDWAAGHIVNLIEFGHF